MARTLVAGVAMVTPGDVGRRWMRGVCSVVACALIAGCAPQEPVVSAPSAPDFNGTPPQGFGPVTMVPVAAGRYRVASESDLG